VRRLTRLERAQKPLALLGVVVVHALFIAALSTQLHWTGARVVPVVEVHAVVIPCDTDTDCMEKNGGDGDPD